MLEPLSTVKGVANVTSLGSLEANTTDYLIEPKEGFDIRQAVFDRVVARGKTLLSLASNRASLEQIFLRLTEAENDEVKRMLGTDKQEETTETDVTEIEIEIPEEKEEN